jgi:hypothetical protein
MTMLSLSRRLGITPRPDHDEYDPAAAGWLDSVRPEDPQQGAVRAYVPQQWAGTNAVRERERANFAADEHPAGGHGPTARGPHPLGSTEAAAEAPWPPSAGIPAGPAETQPIKRQAARSDGAWPEVCDQFGSQLLVLAEQLRVSVDALEAGEDDPERLKRLYQVDHAVARMRLASRQLRTLAGRNEARQAGFTTSLVDVIRMAASAIEWYPQVTIGPVTDLAVLGYAADDVATLMSALLDNATRYSPGTVTVSCHLLEEGGVMLRVEDTGIGIPRDQVTRLNAALAGPVPGVDESTARHTGFPVVHRIARKHSLDVRFAARNRPGTGTIAMVMLPAQLLCAIPAQDAPRRAAADERPAPQASSPVPEMPRRERTDPTAAVSEPSATAEIAPLPTPALEPPQPLSLEAPVASGALPQAPAAEAMSPTPTAVPAELTEPDQAAPPSELPRRERPSLRADEPKQAATAPQPQPQPHQAAARRAFADDLSAFSQGIQDALAARGITGGLVSALFDGAPIEEGAQS